MEEKKKKKNKKKKGLHYNSMNGIHTLTTFFPTKREHAIETAKNKEQKFERQNRYKMIKDICQK